MTFYFCKQITSLMILTHNIMFDVEMKRHQAKVTRVCVVDFPMIFFDAENQIEHVMIDWEVEKDNRLTVAEQTEEKKKALENCLDELRTLHEKARAQPVSLGRARDVPLALVSGCHLDPSPLDTRSQFSYILFHDYIYQVTGPYTESEFNLLVLAEFDRERRMFERLYSLHVDGMATLPSAQRERIPEQIRIFVWRRDGGKCAHCGSRDKLEYDHIVPVSRGGSNTSRNIELLCEACNRTKSDMIQ